jgi:hypothetical protein
VALAFAVVGTVMLFLGCVRYGLGSADGIHNVGHNGEEEPVFSTFLWQFGGFSALCWVLFALLKRPSASSSRAKTEHRKDAGRA